MIPSGSYKPLKDRAFFQITGPDAQRYLNGQMTQKVQEASHRQALATCITNAKGRLQGFGFVRAIENGYLLDFPIEIRESMMQRLDMYLIADEAELVDVTEEIQLYHVIGQAPSEDTCACSRIGIDGFDTPEMPTGSLIDEDFWEASRIFYGVPAWGKELDESVLPPEAKLEESAISYDKGCYTGQEVISRMRSSGRVNRRLQKFELSGELEVPINLPNPEDPEGKPAGVITSVANLEGKWVGLGYLNRKFFEEKSLKIGEILANVR